MREYKYEQYVAKMNYEEYKAFLEDLYKRGVGGPARYSIKKSTNRNFSIEHLDGGWDPWMGDDVDEIMDLKTKLEFYIWISASNSKNRECKIEYLKEWGFELSGR